MDASTARQRFTFLAEAFNGEGGFAPRVTWESQAITTTGQHGNVLSATRRVPKIASPCHLVPHQRESAERYAARCAMATYENHLREACERFVGYLGRRRPMRDGADAPLVWLLLKDADMRGTPLDGFLFTLALEAKARGSMLLLIDMPRQDAPASLLDQIERRAVPYLRPIFPEALCDYAIDDETGLFTSVSVACREDIGGTVKACIRTWDAAGWALHCDDKVIDQGPHPFGQCPVLALTENGQPYPCIGKYAQIADLSLRAFNARSELIDLLRAQGFGLLVMQVPPETQAQHDAANAVATVGLHSMLMYPGERPGYISPDAVPAQTYLQVIEQLQQSIRRVAMDEATTEGGAAESGVARKLRFERLNADLASFAGRLQTIERRMWTLFHRALKTTDRVSTEWPTDFNLVDTMAEIDVLVAMQTAGFPPAAIALKQRSVAAAEFDAADEDDKAAVLLAIDEQAQEGVQEVAPA